MVATSAQTAAPQTETAPRTKSLIMTLWGDVILSFGGTIWLGSLVRLMAPFGIDERSVRTSVQRLVADGWLEATSTGRRRELTMPGQRLSELRTVQARIYRTRPDPWDELWRLAVIAPKSPARREMLRRELTWLGFAAGSPNLFLHPRCEWPLLRRHLAGKGLEVEIDYFFEARSVEGLASPARQWPLEKLRADWEAFEAHMTSFKSPGSDERAFVSRVRTIDAFRRLILRDPGLPHSELPQGWPETDTRMRLKEFYAPRWTAGDHFAARLIERSDGSRPTRQPDPVDRFAD